MKPRFKVSTHGVLILCKEYPNCDCEGHHIYEKNKKLNATKGSNTH